MIAYRDNGIVFVAKDGSYRADRSLSGIWILSLETSERRRIFAGGNLPSWSPDGSQLVFYAGQILKMNVDGSGLSQLTLRGRNGYPSWSPDGSKIAYDSDFESEVGHVVWVMHSDGTQARNISTMATEEWRMPSWRPDGQQIVHIRYADEVGFRPEIYTMNTSGDDSRRITHRRGRESTPRFSPDGGRIAFSADGQVWLMSASGHSPRQVTTRGGVDPSWSPDGTKLLYTRMATSENGPSDGVLWIINLATLEETQITFKWPEIVP